MEKYGRWVALWLVLLGSLVRGAETNGWQRMEFTVDGAARRALVYVPTNAAVVSTPVVFVFHGHGGSAENVVKSFGIDRQWPAAISVYMQGLPTPGQLTDPEGYRPGWQTAVGDQGDRDLKFFDAVLARLKQDYNVDKKRVYCTGHSNGGGFTYLLWLARPNVFAAVAPSAAAAKYAHQLIAKPALIMGGENDPLVKFEWQKLTIQVVRTGNGCSAKGQPWEKQCTIYPSAGGTPVVTFTYPGGHQFNPASPALIVKFFKEHPGAGN
jgi:polyhydroxybutyrate depolymerase